MGGVAGHLAHLYDNRDLTYNKMAEILQKAATGELIGTEKTDGYNIYLGFVDGKARAARNKGDMSRGGMTMQDLTNRTFQGGENAKKAYVTAFKAYEKALDSLAPEEKEKIFGVGGEIFYNTEIQGPVAPNVVNYDENVLNIHRMGHKRYNKDTNRLEVVDADEESAFLDSTTDRFEQATHGESFNVRRTAYLKLNQITDEVTLNTVLNKITATGYEGDLTIDQYLENNIRPMIDKKFANLDALKREQLVDRVLKRDGSVSLTQISKGLPQQERAELSQYVKNSKFIIKKLIEPIESAIHDFAVELLRGLKSAYVLDNSKEVGRLKKEVEDAINAIKSYEGPEKETAQDILRQQLIKLKHHDNIDTVVEGFAFQYDGQMYKFTGNFAPMNQLLGLFRYGRGNIPKMVKESILEQNEGEYDEVLPFNETKIGLVPMSAKPYHAGHHMLIQLAAISEITDEIQELELPVNDIVGVFISFSGRGVRKIKDPTDSRTINQGARRIEDPKPGETPIFGSDMEHIWQNILKPNLELSEKVKLISPADGAHESPVRNIHDICGALKEAFDAQQETFEVPHLGISARVNQTVINIYSDSEDIVQNYSDDIMEEYGELWKSESLPSIRPIGVPREKTVEISGTAMRDFLCKGDIEQFSDMLPPLPQDKKEELANILIKSIECGIPLKRRELQEGTHHFMGIFRGLVDEVLKEISKAGKKKISKKIPILKDEGYPHKQAIAIAHSMEKKKKLEEDDLEETSMSGGSMAFAAGVPKRRKRNLKEDEVNEVINYLLQKLGV